ELVSAIELQPIIYGPLVLFVERQRAAAYSHGEVANGSIQEVLLSFQVLWAAGAESGSENADPGRLCKIEQTADRGPFPISSDMHSVPALIPQQVVPKLVPVLIGYLGCQVIGAGAPILIETGGVNANLRKVFRYAPDEVVEVEEIVTEIVY